MKSKSQNKKGKQASIMLSVSNKHGIPCLEDFLTEIQRRYDVEKNIKNNLYHFIIENGMSTQLVEYSYKYDLSAPNVNVLR